MKIATLIAGPELSPEMRKQVLSAFVYRWTFDNPQRARVYHCNKCDVKNPYVNEQSAEGHQHPTIPLISDDQWIREHAFYFTNDGRLYNTGDKAHAQPVYLAQHNANRYASVDIKFAIEKAAYSPEEQQYKSPEEMEDFLLNNGWAKENGHHGASWWMGEQMWYKPGHEEDIPYQDTEDAYEKESSLQETDNIYRELEEEGRQDKELHEQDRDAPSLGCKFCTDVFSSWNELDQHVREKHRNELGLGDKTSAETGQFACCGGWHNIHKPGCSVKETQDTKTMDMLMALPKRSAEECKDCGAPLNNAEGEYCSACMPGHVDEDAHQFEKESMIGHDFDNADNQAIRPETHIEDPLRVEGEADRTEFTEPRLGADEEGQKPSVARQILEQLGGNKFIVMTGAKKLVGGANDLSFTLPGGGGFTKNGINAVRIELMPSDTYKVTFSRVRGGKVSVVAEHDDIHVDGLREIFEHETGLRTSLGTMGHQAAGSNSGEDDDRGAGDVWREFYYSRYEGLPADALMSGMKKSSKSKCVWCSEVHDNEGDFCSEECQDAAHEDNMAKDGAAPAGALDIDMPQQIVPTENWQCQNCGHEGMLDVRGRCESCGSDAVGTMLPAPPEYTRTGIGEHGTGRFPASASVKTAAVTLTIANRGDYPMEVHASTCPDLKRKNYLNVSQWQINGETLQAAVEAEVAQLNSQFDSPYETSDLFRIMPCCKKIASEKTAQGAGNTTVTMQEQNATIPGTPGATEPMAVPDAIDQQPGPHSPNAPATAPRTPTLQPRVVDVPAGTVPDDSMSMTSSEDADWESMHPKRDEPTSGEDYEDVDCPRCGSEETEIDEREDGGYDIYCDDCEQVTWSVPGKGGFHWHGPKESPAPEPALETQYTDDENRQFTEFMKGIGASKKFASLPGAGKMIGNERVVLAEDWIIYIVDHNNMVWYYDTEVWPEWGQVENPWGEDRSKPQPTVEVMIPFAETHTPIKVTNEDKTQMTLQQFMAEIKEPEMPKQSAASNELREGMVDKIQFTQNGYQLTTIDSVTYATLWDADELPVAEGENVVFTIGENVQGYNNLPFADILEVKNTPKQNAEKQGAEEKIQLQCNECGKNFKVSPNAADPSCPKCGGVDWDVKQAAGAATTNGPVLPNVVQQQALHTQLQQPQAPGSNAAVALMPGQQQEDETSIGHHTVEPELANAKYYMSGSFEAPVDLVDGEMEKLGGGLNSFLVKFDDGNSLVTDFNGTLEEAQAYYIGQWFNFGDTDEHPKDLMVQGVSVEDVGQKQGSKTAGHFYNTVTGKGKNKQEAQNNAIQDFLFEHGNRHSVREVLNPKLIGKVPPMASVKRNEGNYIVNEYKPNPKAPKDQWLEEWEFELHTHA